MALEVIGAGFGRTGTMSLKGALERLGFDRCYHMAEVYENPHHVPLWSRAHAGEPVDWSGLFEGFRAAVDWPSCNLWREQLAHFPDAKVLLSLRDADGWYRSVMNTIWPSTQGHLASGDPNRERMARWIQEVVWDHVFDGRLADRDHVIGIYEAHNRAVIDEVPADRLLVYRPGDGWEPLCDFLGVPVPDEPYPHKNTTEQFLSAGLQK